MLNILRHSLGYWFLSLLIGFAAFADMGIPTPFPSTRFNPPPQEQQVYPMHNRDFRREYPYGADRRHYIPHHHPHYLPYYRPYVYPYFRYQRTVPRKQVIIVVPPPPPPPKEEVVVEPPKEIKGKIIRPPGEEATIPQEYKIEETPVP